MIKYKGTFMEDETQGELVDKINSLVVDLNILLKEAFDRGDIVKGSAALAYTPDGPVFDFTIDYVKVGFWKKP